MITSFEAWKISVSNSWEPLIINTESFQRLRIGMFFVDHKPKLVGLEQDQSYVSQHQLVLFVVIRPEVISINLDYSRPRALESTPSIRPNYI